MIAIIDSGIANVRSVANAFAALEQPAQIVDRPQQLVDADRIVLPGVGAFADGMRNLAERDFVEALAREVRERGKPLLGICLGMQLLTDESHEHGRHRGLGWVAGTTEPLAADRPGLRIPHVGWNECTLVRRAPFFADLPDRPVFYFVHSYHVRPENGDVIAATCEYGPPFVAALVHDNLLAVQFHPEKSHRHGLLLLRNFAQWRP